MGRVYALPLLIKVTQYTRTEIRISGSGFQSEVRSLRRKRKLAKKPRRLFLNCVRKQEIRGYSPSRFKIFVDQVLQVPLNTPEYSSEYTILGVRVNYFKKYRKYQNQH